MTHPILPYSDAKIAEIRSWVTKCPTWLDARNKIADKLGTHPDNVTKMHKRHSFWDVSTAPVIDKPAPRPLRRLFLDIETSPNIVMSWRIGYKINLSHDNILHERAVICACWSWDGEDEVHFSHWDKDQNDRAVLEPLIKAMEEADEIVYQNGDRFDLPWVKTRCLWHKILTRPSYKTVDTLQWARKNFYFNSNKLDYIAQFLGVGGKLKTEFGLWKSIVLDKDAKALKRMVVYCQNDIVILKKVWKRLSEVMPHKTHAGVLAGKDKWTCPRTGSTNVHTSKTRVTANGTIQYEMHCKDSGCYYTIGATAHAAYKAAKS